MRFQSIKKVEDFNLEFPEELDERGRTPFYEEVIRLFGSSCWIAMQFNPSPSERIRPKIEKDCLGLLSPIEMQYRGIAWICAAHDLRAALPGLFTAFIPELMFLGFDFKPGREEILSAQTSEFASPATKLLLFDEGVLWEVRDQDGIRSR